jgi:uncharacterized protein YdeI (YjbR/CyaY-like superfamily)
MPEFVRAALLENKLMGQYLSRPPYQQNDYIGWINRAKQAVTKQKRLNQMLEELKRGDRYMKMAYKPRAPQQELKVGACLARRITGKC